MKPLVSVLALFLFAAVPAPVHAAPADLNVQATQGAFEPWTDATMLVIDSTGAGEYREEDTTFESPSSPPNLQNSFSLTTGDLDAIWNAVTANNFFSLPGAVGDTSLVGGDFLELHIRGNGMQHTVLLSHGASPEIEAIVTAINSVTPAGNDLSIPANPAKGHIHGPDPNAPHDHPHDHGRGGGDHDHGWLDRQEQRERHVDHPHDKVRNWAQSGASKYGEPLLATANPPKFPGGSVSYCCPLQDWVDSGKVSLTATGDINGNAAKMTVDNSTPAVKDTIKLTVNLEFWGDEADSATVANVVMGITGIFNNLSTSGGKPIQVCVNTKLDSTTNAAPNTPGYHQIELDNVDDAGNPIISHVHGIGPINDGTNEGTWEGDPPPDLSQASLLRAYAHEVGHLLGLPDRYKDYRRLANGNWQLRGGGPELTPAQLGTQMFNQFGTDTEADWQNRLSAAGLSRFTPRCPGVAATDIMAMIGPGAALSQGDVDTIAECPGLKVQVRAGDILLSESDTEQDMVITKDCDFFTPKDSTFCWDIIQATCIDPSKSPPTTGNTFDVTTNICDWSCFDSADNLKKLLAVIQEKDMGGTPQALDAIWWIVAGVPFAGTNPLLACAELSSAERKDDWPEDLSNSGAGGQSELVYPIELITIKIDPFWWYLYPATPWGYTAYWVWPYTWPFEPLFGPTQNYFWGLDYLPPLSGGYLNPLTGPSTTLFPDSCGAYRVFVDGEVDVTIPGTNGFLNAGENSAFFVSDQILAFETPTELNQLTLNPPEAWTLTTSHSFSGDASLNSGLQGPGEPYVGAHVTVDLTTATDNILKFMIRTELDPNHFVQLLVNETPQWGLSGDSGGWQQVHIPLPPGGVSDLVWLVDRSIPSTAASEVFLDDLMLPGEIVVGVPGDDPTAPRVTLAQNAPNPVRSATSIAFKLSRETRVELKVYDANGALVRTVLNERRGPGVHDVPFDAEGMAAGVYFYKLSTDSGIQESRKMVVLN